MITSVEIAEDPEVMAIYGAGREALTFIASRLPAYEFFIGAQERGLPIGIVYTPDESFADPHVVARGFPTPVEHAGAERVVTYPGAPYRFSAVTVGDQPAGAAHRRAQRRDPRSKAVNESNVSDSLTGPGAPFEIAEEIVLGERMPVFKNRPRSARELLVDSSSHGDALRTSSTAIDGFPTTSIFSGSRRLLTSAA